MKDFLEGPKHLASPSWEHQAFLGHPQVSAGVALVNPGCHNNLHGLHMHLKEIHHSASMVKKLFLKKNKTLFART